MSYRKILAENIFTGYELLTNTVLIITKNGTIIDTVNAQDAGEDDLEKIDGMLCPAFINAHCHTELSHMHGQIDAQAGMVPFLLTVLQRRYATAHQKEKATAEAIQQMANNGIVAVGDICNTAESANNKYIQKHNMYFHNFVEVSGFAPANSAQRFAQAVEIYTSFSRHFAPEQISITPHAPYSVAKSLFSLIASQNPLLLSIHNQESEAEQNFIDKKAGEMLELYKAIGVNIEFFQPQHQRSLSYMLPMLPPQCQVLLVHNCHTTMPDMEELEQYTHRFGNNFYMCVCPNANLYIGNPLPDMALLTSYTQPICIGTDSLASNKQLCILEELKTLQTHFGNISLPTLLQWATINGARALMIDNKYGSFAKGKTPGILHISNIQNGQLANAVVKKIA